MDGPIHAHKHGWTAESIWFEVWGSWIRVNKNRFFQKISEKFRFFSGNFTHTKSIFQAISEKFRFFRKFNKKIDFPGKNWPFIAVIAVVGSTPALAAT